MRLQYPSWCELLLAYASLCQPVLAQNPIFPEHQELVVKCGHHGESIYTTEIGNHCKSGFVFFPGELVVNCLPLQVAQQHGLLRQNHPFNSYRP